MPSLSSEGEVRELGVVHLGDQLRGGRRGRRCPSGLRPALERQTLVRHERREGGGAVRHPERRGLPIRQALYRSRRRLEQRERHDSTAQPRRVVERLEMVRDDGADVDLLRRRARCRLVQLERLVPRRRARRHAAVQRRHRAAAGEPSLDFGRPAGGRLRRSRSAGRLGDLGQLGGRRRHTSGISTASRRSDWSSRRVIGR